MKLSLPSSPAKSESSDSDKTRLAAEPSNRPSPASQGPLSNVTQMPATRRYESAGPWGPGGRGAVDSGPAPGSTGRIPSIAPGPLYPSRLVVCLGSESALPIRVGIVSAPSSAPASAPQSPASVLSPSLPVAGAAGISSRARVSLELHLPEPEIRSGGHPGPGPAVDRAG